MEKTLEVRIKQKKDTHANWTIENPLLLNGEAVYAVMDNGEIRQKVGDGTTRYTALPFIDDEVRISLDGHTHPNATQSAAGFMSSADKAKLDGIASGANSITVDSELSSTSTNPVQNKVINSALAGKAASSHTHSAATTSVAGFMSASDKSKLDGITASADSVSFSRSLTSGTKVGTITINGTGTDLYAPTNTDTHYASGTVVGSSASAISNTTSALTNGNVYMNHIENGSVKNSHKISGSGATTVTSDASGNIVVSSTNTTYGVATSSGLGLVKSGTDITVDSSGNVSVNDDSHNHVISNIDNLQSSLDSKQATVTGGASTITSSNLTANRALISDSSGKVAVSDVTSTELGYLDGVTSNVQTQLDGKAASSHNHSASNITSGTLSSDRLPTVPIAKGGTGATTASGALTNLGITATASELNYVDGVTSNIQTQLNNKASSSHTHNYAGSSSAGGAANAVKATEGTVNVDRNVWFSDSSAVGVLGYNDKFKYNPSTNVLTVGTISGNATSANKLNTNAGDANTPVYFSNGVPVACTYTLGKSVPSNAVFTDTTYSAATTSANGLMSASDKAKLDGIASGANNYTYTLPTASSSTLGGVKTTSTVTSTSGLTACPIISGVPYYKDTNTTYTLSSFGITATAAELNKLDGVTATTTEINYVDGVTSNIQTQLNALSARITALEKSIGFVATEADM